MSQSICHNQPMWCCDYSPNGNLVAAAGTGKCIFIYDTGHPPKSMELRLRLQGMKSDQVKLNSLKLLTTRFHNKETLQRY